MVLSVHHVDDMLILVAGKTDDEKSLKFLNESSPVKNIGEIAHNMGCSFTCEKDNRTLSTSQETYMDKSIEHSNATKNNPVPACLFVDLDARRETKESAKVSWREATHGACYGS